MNKRLLVIAALGVLPLVQAEGQQSQAKKDSSSTAAQALSTAAGLGGGLLALFSSPGGDYRSADGWCVGSCEIRSSNRSGFGFSMGADRSQRNARGGATSLLPASPQRRAVMLETLDQALTQAGLRIVGGRGNRVWFGTDGSDMAISADGADVAANQERVDSDAFGGTGVPQVGTETSEAPLASGCIIASCMLGEWQPMDEMLDGAGVNQSSYVISGSLQFGADPISGASMLDGDVNTLVNPEPGTVALMMSGLAGLAFVRRRTRKNVK